MSTRRVAMKFMTWGGPMVALALVVAWWFSGTTWITYVGSGDWRASAAAGLVGVSHEPGLIAQTEQMTGVPVPRGLQTMNVPRNMAWWFRLTWEPARKSFAVPFWFPFGIVVGLSAAAWHRDIAARRRARVGHCPQCYYDRKGLAAAVPCPECGALATTPTKQ